MKAIIFLALALIMMGGAMAVPVTHMIDFQRGEGNECTATGTSYGGDLGLWGVAPAGQGGYGNEGRDHFCMIMGPGQEECKETEAWALQMTQGMDVNKFRFRYLDGSQDDSFYVYVTDAASQKQYVGMVDGSMTSGEDWLESDWLMLPFTIPAGETRTIYVESVNPANQWCQTWGQVAVDYVELGYEEEIPEFTTLGAGVALIGALIGLVLMRRR